VGLAGRLRRLRLRGGALPAHEHRHLVAPGRGQGDRREAALHLRGSLLVPRRGAALDRPPLAVPGRSLRRPLPRGRPWAHPGQGARLRGDLDASSQGILSHEDRGRRARRLRGRDLVRALPRLREADSPDAPLPRGLHLSARGLPPPEGREAPLDPAGGPGPLDQHAGALRAGAARGRVLSRRGVGGVPGFEEAGRRRESVGRRTDRSPLDAGRGKAEETRVVLPGHLRRVRGLAVRLPRPRPAFRPLRANRPRRGGRLRPERL
jgi:hypothetical protein